MPSGVDTTKTDQPATAEVAKVASQAMEAGVRADPELDAVLIIHEPELADYIDITFDGRDYRLAVEGPL